jgi:hypothetical protein
MTFSDGESAALVTGRLVSWSYFRVLGLAPELGRAFSYADANRQARGAPCAPRATQSAAYAVLSATAGSMRMARRPGT